MQRGGSKDSGAPLTLAWDPWGSFCLSHWEPQEAPQAEREMLPLEEGPPSGAAKDNQWERVQRPDDLLGGCGDSPRGGDPR